MEQESSRGTTLEVFLAFLRLGCVSFGGPIAHLGYLQEDIVVQRRWCNEDSFAELIALAQSLPGPSSSQVCFGLGVLRAGWLGGIAAWTAFTLPSALLMLLFAFAATHLSGTLGLRIVHGLQLVAVAIVAQAVLMMQRSLAPDRGRMIIAVGALVIVSFGPARFGTLLAILLGAIIGLAFFRTVPPASPRAFLVRPSRIVGIACAATLFGLLLLLPVTSRLTHLLALQVLSAFYTCGALVFGGGHVVLPLLESAFVTPGWVSEPVFLSGYGAAQAVPGPLFTFGAFLGASIQGSAHRVLFGLLGLLGLSAPGLLAMGSILPFWQSWRERHTVQSALRGVNAAVVGVLIAALFHPLWTTAIHGTADFCIALLAFVLITQWKLQPILVVAITLALNLAGSGAWH
ncbi:chromate transporter, chromate ion transporter family [Terriglobus roseus DSM 18391]|uniref:Chromate transporter, chromate ion transporter family n=1 Tax=Terriglobus roseus (strain DSM 18391 / NRRL B-41598 / KBS 63) TaxID=926566 RepID=I3ZHB3_TERRK|nr:chromate efflux transporter [Terriglobus roseus]AFL88290.1 chromate transporter, chromate ion transporter family [Terriglobus roseus DSM 18391]AFL88631.1 chromate transporter, chromate ion transporter family [Terriglobus roseus DSM 18391]